MSDVMKPIVQLEKTGCGIASVANIAQVSYHEAKQVANAMGIYADDPSLWSDTRPVRKLLREFGFTASQEEIPFAGWSTLPDCALLSIKWHLENGTPFWHWVVFIRQNRQQYVLDSKQSLKSNLRTDFGRMKPKWYIPVKPGRHI